jgi:hypothetical protein
MNLYFLSLLQPTKKREKNLAVLYGAEDETTIKKRHPFIEVGDMIAYQGFWDGNCVVDYMRFGLNDYDGNPFFYGDAELGFSKRILDKISKCNIEREEPLEDVDVGHLLISKFKIKKAKYDLVAIFLDVDPMNEIHFQELENKIKDSRCCFVRTTPDGDGDYEIEIGDYLERYKRRIFLYYLS